MECRFITIEDDRSKFIADFGDSGVMSPITRITVETGMNMPYDNTIIVGFHWAGSYNIDVSACVTLLEDGRLQQRNPTLGNKIDQQFDRVFGFLLSACVPSSRQRWIDYILPALHPPVRRTPKNPEPYSAVNPRPYDPTSDEAVAYAAMLEDIAKIGRLRRENAKLVDRVTKLKACVDLLSAQIAKVPSCER